MRVPFDRSEWGAGNTSVEITVKPHRPNGVLLFNQARRNRATQLKLTFEKGERFRLSWYRNAGEVHVLASPAGSGAMYEWNVISLEWMRSGNESVRMCVNNGTWVETVMVGQHGDNQPGDEWLVGGLASEESTDEVHFSGSAHVVMLEFVAPFHGYVASMKQNGVEHLSRVQLTASNIRASLSILRSATPELFLYRTVTCGSDVGVDDDRVLTCSEGRRGNEHVTWYKDDELLTRSSPVVRIADSSLFDHVAGLYTCVIGKRAVVGHVIGCKPRDGSEGGWRWELAILYLAVSLPALYVVVSFFLLVCKKRLVRGRYERVAEADARLRRKRDKIRAETEKLQEAPWFDNYSTEDEMF